MHASRRTVIRGFWALAAFAVLGAMPGPAHDPAPTCDPTVTALERNKLTEEIAKLKEETARLRSQND